MGTGRAGRGPQAAAAALSCGRLLRRYRSAAGLTQEELAARAGYSADYIGKLERGQRDLPAAAAGHLAAVLGLGDEERAALVAARERAAGKLPAPVRPAGPLAGRDAELAGIGRLLAGDGPPVLLLAGEPGIGKTRLLEEAAERAAGAGWGPARGGCLRRADDPYAPLSGALADALARLPARDRAGAVARAGPVGLLLPELAPPGGPGQDAAPAQAGPEQQRRLLAWSAGRLLRAAAGPAGTLLVLDDLHWAGPDAAGLLGGLLAAAAGSPLRVIGAYRDSEAAPGAWLAELTADLARAGLIRVPPLAPLTDEQAGRLLAALTPAAALPGVLPAIVRRAGGVPFFLVSYAEQVRGGLGGADLAVPWTVAQVIGQRVAGLPGPARDLVAVAAVAGRVVPHAVLAEVTGRGEDELLAAVEAALAARLLAEDGPDRYRFGHDLIRETVEDGLSAARRRLLHRRIGQALERQGGAAAPTLAFHFAAAGQDAAAAGYLERAGDQAGQQVAWSAAAEFYAAAAARLEAAGRAAAAVPVTEKQGVALYRAGRYAAAITALEAALAAWRAAGDAEAAARVTGRLAEAHYRAGSRGDELGPLAGPAGAASPGALAQWEGQLLLLWAQGAYDKIADAGRALARAGRAAQNPQMQAIGTRVEGGGLIGLGQLAAGAALMAAALPADPAAAAPRDLDSAALLSAAYLAMGAVHRCAALSEPMLAAAGRAGDQVTAAMHTAMLAGACYVRGDWDRGRDLAAQARQRFAASSSPTAVRAAGVLGGTLIWHGDWDAARAYLDGCLHTARDLPAVQVERAVLACLAELDLLEGRPRDALARLAPVTAGHPAPATEDLTYENAVQLLTALAAACLQTTDLPRARAYAGRAVAEARRMGTWVHGLRALEVRGMIAARDGHHDQARAAYHEGLHRARAMPFPYAQARLLHASDLLDRQQHDHPAAHAKLAQALAILEDLGADNDAAGSARPSPTPRPPDHGDAR
jgi:transcriptional regulator with XRE-family HTH domain/tetratricopeptide (TPR) repeat protein